MKIAVDLGNWYVKGISETGERVIFRSVLAEGKRRTLFSLTKNRNVTDTLQVSFVNNGQTRDFYVGKMAERFGALPEYVFGKERFDTESAERLVFTALALLNPKDEPVDLILDFPYSQFAMVDSFTHRLQGRTQTVDVQGGRPRQITIHSVAEFPQGLVAAYALAQSHQDTFTDEDGYIAIVDIGGDTTDVVVLESGDELLTHEELSGTLAHGTRDLTQSIRRIFEAQTGDILDADLIDRVIERGNVFYANRTWSFSEEVARAKQNLAALLKSQLSELWTTRKNRIRAVFWVGGGAQLLGPELKGFHFHEVFSDDAQWQNAKGCLIAVTESSEEQQLQVQPESHMSQPQTVKVEEPARPQETVDTYVQSVSTTHEHQTHKPVSGTPQGQKRTTAHESTPSSPEAVPTEPKKTDAVPVAHQPSAAPNRNIPRRFQEGQGAW